MTDQVRIGDDGSLEVERTWDGEPLWSVETQQELLFAGDAFRQMPGQLSVEQIEAIETAAVYCPQCNWIRSPNHRHES
jgi:hypothetical protein